MKLWKLQAAQLAGHDAPACSRWAAAVTAHHRNPTPNGDNASARAAVLQLAPRLSACRPDTPPSIEARWQQRDVAARTGGGQRACHALDRQRGAPVPAALAAADELVRQLQLRERLARLAPAARTHLGERQAACGMSTGRHVHMSLLCQQCVPCQGPRTERALAESWVVGRGGRAPKSAYYEAAEVLT